MLMKGEMTHNTEHTHAAVECRVFLVLFYKTELYQNNNIILKENKK